MTTRNSPTRRALLAAAIIASLSAAPLSARDLPNFNINVAGSKPVEAAAAAPKQATGLPTQGRDPLGRETFSWLQQDLPAAAKSAAATPESVARAHLARLLVSAKRGGDVLDALALQKVDRQRGESTLVHFQPRIDGMEIFREELALLIDRNQRLVAMRGPLPDAAPSAAKSLPAFTLDASQAIAAALATHDFDAAVAKRMTQTGTHGEYRHFQLAPTAKSRSGAVATDLQRAKPVWFRTHEGLQPAWYVETRVADNPSVSKDFYGQVISAVDGSLLFRINQKSHATAEYTYRVWAEDGADSLPFPNVQGRNGTPDPDGTPANTPLPFVPQALRTLASIPFSQAATDGWLAPGTTVTSGNNVIAYADLAEPDGLGAGDLQPTTTSPNTFDYAFDGNLLPAANATQTAAATVQLFYWHNWLHDAFYDHGFAEADGNAQADNFGRGGLGNDRIIAEAQDYDVQDNAFMSTPADGFSPLTSMGLTSSTPQRDFTLQGDTVAHEWAHYLSNRLVGNASGLDNEHGRGMGEGWSDFVALLVLAKDEDRQKSGNASFEGAYAAGGYTADDSYYGIRRYPYSTDFSKNPLTFRYVTDGLPLPLQPVPAGGAGGGNNSQVHNQGEVWASMLWDGYVSLLNDNGRLSFTEAQARMKDYLLGGMKLTPVAPTMPEARDAILATILAAGEQRDFELFVAAFAKRGLGAGAFVPNRYSESMAGAIESTSTGGDVAATSIELGLATGCDTDAVLDVGETADVTMTLVNTGFVDLPSATVTVTSNSQGVTFPAGNTVTVGALPLMGRTQVKVPVQLAASVPTNSSIQLTVTPDAPGIASPPGVGGSVSTFVNFDEVPRSTTVEGFDGNYTNWQPVRDPLGGGDGTWIQLIENGGKFLRGQDTGSRTVNWLQSPVMSVGSEPLVITLNHRYSFEKSDLDYDGGVIQVSIDGGTTWTDIDPVAAGYLGTLPDCCDNPLAGKQALTGISQVYPVFFDQTINLGTTYANQPNFRLRFGVATDAASSASGWDINSVGVSGLLDTPFTAVAAQSASCALDSSKTLQGAMSGTYYSVDRSGEGVLVDFGQVAGTPVVFFSWYTYDGGEQQWLVGNSPFSLDATSVLVPVINTSGTSFGDAFDSDAVVSTAWGNVSLSFPDCDRMTLTYQKTGGESGSLTLQRGLERTAVGQCDVLNGGLSGTYFSPERAGEGVLVDFGAAGGTPVQFFAWYTYDAGRQQWLVGNKTFGAGDSEITVDLLRTSGADFGNGFRAGDVVTTPWGNVSQRFLDCNTLELTWRKADGETGTLQMSRALERLGDGQCR